MGDAWLTPWLQKLPIDQAGTGLEAVASTVIHYVTYPIEISALSAVLILVGVLAVLKISLSMVSKAAAGVVLTDPITFEDVQKFTVLADQADIVEYTKQDGSVSRVSVSYPDRLSDEERRLLRVMAQTNDRPLPFELVPVVFSGNNIAKRLSVQGLINKNLIKLDQGRLSLTADGLQWAHEQLSRGLGKPKPQIPDVEDLTLGEDKNTVLAILVGEGGAAPIDDIQDTTKWNMVRVQHVVDQLVEMQFVELPRTVHGHQLVRLSKLGRQYTMDKGFDLT